VRRRDGTSRGARPAQRAAVSAERTARCTSVRPSSRTPGATCGVRREAPSLRGVSAACAGRCAPGTGEPHPVHPSRSALCPSRPPSRCLTVSTRAATLIHPRRGPSHCRAVASCLRAARVHRAAAPPSPDLTEPTRAAGPPRCRAAGRWGAAPLGRCLPGSSRRRSAAPLRWGRRAHRAAEPPSHRTRRVHPRLGPRVAGLPHRRSRHRRPTAPPARHHQSAAPPGRAAAAARAARGSSRTHLNPTRARRSSRQHHRRTMVGDCHCGQRVGRFFTTTPATHGRRLCVPDWLVFSP
jgi:hypothetical protein